MAPRIDAIERGVGRHLYGVVDTPFASMERALSDAAAWCAVLILDPNVHRCLSRAADIDVDSANRIRRSHSLSSAPPTKKIICRFA